MSEPQQVAFVSLGCAKNLVDSEKMLGQLAEAGCVLTGDESEADVIGLRYMVRAGYDPEAAPEVWERMAAAAGPDLPPEFMSTHPNPLNRAALLRSMIPQIVAEEGGRD